MIIYIRKWIILLTIILLFFACRERYTSPTIKTIQAIAEIDNSNYKGRIITEDTIDEIRNILKQYEEDIENNINKKEELGQLYKQLGVMYLEIDSIKQEIQIVLADSTNQINTLTERDDVLVTETLAYIFMDKRIYKEAMYYFLKAIEIYPENELLYYYSGLCTTRIAKSIIQNSSEKYEWLLAAEGYYKRAIELYPNYSEVLYALSILYIYEFNLPEDAEPYLLELKNLEQENTDARFLLANVYYMTARYEEAIFEYSDILSITDSSEIKERAIANQKQITEILENRNE